MSNQTDILRAAAGLASSEVISAGETATAPPYKKIAFMMPIGDDATLDGITNGPSGLSASQVLTKDVPYPFKCDAITLDSGSSGDLFVAYIDA